MKKIYILIIIVNLAGCADKYQIYKVRPFIDGNNTKYLTKNSKLSINTSEDKKNLKFNIFVNQKQECVDNVSREGNLIFKCEAIMVVDGIKNQSYVLSIFMPVNNPNDCDQEAYDDCQISDDIDKCFCIYLDVPDKPSDEVGTGGNIN